MNLEDKILITGSTGMVGSSLKRILSNSGFSNILTPEHSDLELADQKSVSNYFVRHQPDFVFHLAAMVGGIHANNKYPADFIYQNTQIQCNVIDSSYRNGVKKLLFPGSACTYPKMASQPIPENEFLNGKIEPTNLAYAAAKINGIVMCQSYSRQYGFSTVIPMPTNTYGIGDNFDPKQSHVIPALMQRFHEAKLEHLDQVVIWGSGKALREFIYVDDLSNALIFLMDNQHENIIINVGTMQEVSIGDLAKKIAKIIGYSGSIEFDNEKPDGTPRKCLDSTKLMNLGWKPSICLEDGLKIMYEHYLKG